MAGLGSGSVAGGHGSLNVLLQQRLGCIVAHIHVDCCTIEATHHFAHHEYYSTVETLWQYLYPMHKVDSRIMRPSQPKIHTSQHVSD